MGVQDFLPDWDKRAWWRARVGLEMITNRRDRKQQLGCVGTDVCLQSRSGSESLETISTTPRDSVTHLPASLPNE